MAGSFFITCKSRVNHSAGKSKWKKRVAFSDKKKYMCGQVLIQAFSPACRQCVIGRNVLSESCCSIDNIC